MLPKLSTTDNDSSDRRDFTRVGLVLVVLALGVLAILAGPKPAL
jgi:hypothetical protein